MGDPPGFFTTLPLVALLGLFGSSAIAAYCVRVLASRYSTELEFPKGGIVLVCASAQLLILLITGSALFLLRGPPSGPLLGPPLPTLLAVYGLPLVLVSLLFGKVVGSRSRRSAPRRSLLLSSGVFAVVHLLTIPTVWMLFIFVELVL